MTGEAAPGTIISPEPILECSREGCDGGNPSTAWNWMINNGDTTCTSQCFSGCAPYDSGAGTSPSCHLDSCDSGSKWPSTYYAGSYKALSRGAISTFQNELSTYGPLQACFSVYNNFYTYFDLHPKGIYTSESGSVVGGHCVKMIGWGTESGTDYWIFANSWDTTWGDGGFFKMLRGSNLCGIENQVSEGFTKSQAARLAISGIDVSVNTSFIVGGWYEQQDLSSDFVKESVEAGTHLLSEKLGRSLNVDKVLAVKSQVVAGVNFLINLSIEERIVQLKLFRDLKYKFSLTSYQFK